MRGYMSPDSCKLEESSWVPEDTLCGNGSIICIFTRWDQRNRGVLTRGSLTRAEEGRGLSRSGFPLLDFHLFPKLFWSLKFWRRINFVSPASRTTRSVRGSPRRSLRTERATWRWKTFWTCSQSWVRWLHGTSRPTTPSRFMVKYWKKMI